MRKYCGNYPVIYLDLTYCDGKTWDIMLSQIWFAIFDMVYRHEELSSELAKTNDPVGSLLRDPCPPVGKSEIKAAFTLKWVIQALYRVHKRTVIVLVDEVDKPINYASEYNFFGVASKFFETFFSSGLSGNIALEKACLMGELDLLGVGLNVTFQSIVYTPIYEQFSKWFGFSEDDLGPFFDDSEIKSLNNWYGGYIFGGTLYINPMSVSRFIDKVKYGPYWVTYMDKPLSVLLTPFVNVPGVLTAVNLILLARKYKIETLMTITLRSELEYFDKSAWSLHSVLHYLVHVGLLSYSLDSSDDNGEVFIPNREVFDHWNQEVPKFVKMVLEDQIRNDLIDSLVSFDTVKLEASMEKVTRYYIGPNMFKDYPNAHTRFFAGLFGATLELHDDEALVSYDVQSNEIRITFNYRDPQIVILGSYTSENTKSLARDAERCLTRTRRKAHLSSMTRYKVLVIGVSFYKANMSALKVEEFEPIVP
jgi:hypothetical protein